MLGGRGQVLWRIGPESRKMCPLIYDVRFRADYIEGVRWWGAFPPLLASELFILFGSAPLTG